MSDFGSMRSLVGWKAIADFFAVSETKMIRYKEELQELGVIFYSFHGRPPQRRVHAFPVKLMAWQGEKTKRGENL
jgi:hypothetical protein